MAKEMRDFIFVKFNEESNLKSRRELLLTKANILEGLKSFRNYKRLRIRELEKKELLRRKMNLFKNSLRILVNMLPKVDMNLAKIDKEIEDIEDAEMKEASNFAIERELREIQEEIRKLG